MSVELFIASTLRLAKDDLDAARVLHANGNRYAIYHVEQAAEKLIRAILTSEGKQASIKHALNEFVAMIPDENPLKTGLKEVEYLSAYATAYRYASPTGKIPKSPSDNEVTELMSKVDKLLQEAASRFGVDFAKPNVPARSPNPLR